MTTVAKTCLAFSLVIPVFSGCGVQLGEPPIKGSGVSKTESRSVAEFNEVDVSHAIKLDLEVGPAASLEIIADDNILPHVKTEVSGKTLKVRINRSMNTSLGVKVKATTPRLESLDGSGASTIAISGVDAGNFRLDLSGASSCKMSGKSDEMKVSLSGASRCTMTGSVGQMTIDCSGASQFSAGDVTAHSVKANLSGASTANVAVSDELLVTASGASKLRYVGTPEILKKDVSGASTVEPN